MPRTSQIKKRWKLPFSKQGTNLHSKKLALDQSPQVEPGKLLSRCNEVNMNQFMACICESNLNALVVSGQFAAEDIAAAWAGLFFEYCDLIEATETKYRIRLKAFVKNEKRKLALADGWQKILAVIYVPAFAEGLKIIGFEYDLNPADPAGFASDMARVKAEISAAKFKLKIKEAELEAINEKQSTKDSVDRKYFSTIFFRINNYAKREAVNGLTMVADYCAALKDYVAYIEITKQNLRQHGIR